MARRSKGPTRFDPGAFVDRLLSPPLSPPPRPLPVLTGLDEARAFVKSLEDRRRFHPLRELRPVSSVTRGSRRLKTAPRKLDPDGIFPGQGLSFSVPREVALCVRRKERREVIFAKRKAGKGSRSPRRRNRWSDVRC